jgi:branched-chain amino acid transport system substrate-binding protein
MGQGPGGAGASSTRVSPSFVPAACSRSTFPERRVEAGPQLDCDLYRSHQTSRIGEIMGGRHRGCLLAPALSLVFAIACNPLGPLQPAQSGPEIVIGVPMAAGGPYVQEAALTRRGYDLWAQWVNHEGGIVVQGVRHRVRLQYEDDQGQPTVAAQVAERMLAQEGIRFLLGPFGTPESIAVAQVANQRHVPVVISNGAAPDIFAHGNRYAFGVVPPADRFPAAIFDMAMAMQPRPSTLAILTADDPFSLDVTQGDIEAAQARGIKVVYEQRYPAGSTDLYPLVAAAKAAHPDIFMDSGHLLEAVACQKAVMDLRLDAKLYAYAEATDEPQFVEALGQAADYVTTAVPWSPAASYRTDTYLSTAQYLAAYRSAYHTNQDPSYVTADATAAALALGVAIQRADSLNPELVRNALASLDVNTFYGRIRFAHDGQSVGTTVLVEQIQQGHRVIVWPSQLAPATPDYPAPTWNARLGPPPTPPKAKLPGTGHPSSS